MAIYRTIQMTFWTDSKVIDDFTPEDRYFYLYLMTNPHTNLAGCYELTMTQMAMETGYTKETLTKLIERMDKTHNVIRYSPQTKEFLMLNWSKYNWTNSPKFKKPLEKEIESIKNLDFKKYLTDLLNGIDTVSIPYQYPIDTNCIDTTVTVTDINNYNLLDKVKPIKQESKSNKTSISVDIYKLLDDTDLDNQVKEKVSEWLTYKSERKEGYKPQGFKSLLSVVKKQANKYGASAVCDVIDLSMSNQWQGILWKKLEENNTKSSAYMDAIKNRVNVVDSWT